MRETERERLSESIAVSRLGLGDMTISYRGRYESVYRERFGHIVYTEREKNKINDIALH